MPGVRKAVTRQVGTKLRLMVDLEGKEGKDVVFYFSDDEPDTCVGLSIGTQCL